jgi:hypothetical protein
MFVKTDLESNKSNSARKHELFHYIIWHYRTSLDQSFIGANVSFTFPWGHYVNLHHATHPLKYTILFFDAEYSHAFAGWWLFWSVSLASLVVVAMEPRQTEEE